MDEGSASPGFATATAVTPEPAEQPASPVLVRYRGTVREGWDIGGNANGGYLMVIAARAAAHAVRRPDPVTVTAHFLTPGAPGPVTIDVEEIRRGRRFAVAGATLTTADGRPLLRLLGTFGELAGGDGTVGSGTTDGEVGADVSFVDIPPPDLPPVERCVPMRPGLSPADGPGPPTFGDRVDLRLHPEDAAFMAGQPSGRARMRGWFRLPGGEPVDTMGLLQASDAFPPTVFNAALPVAWTPTVELTTHVRARPAPGWLRCRFQTHFVTGGFLEEDGEIWDATDRLVAQSRQLALVPRAAPG